MEQIIYYLLEYGVYLLCFYLLYLLVFKGKSDYKFNRFYLMSSNLICLVLPLVNNSLFLAQPVLFSVVLNPIEIAATGTSAIITEVNESIPFTTLIAVIYFTITAVLLARFIYGLNKINSYKTNASISMHEAYSLIESEEVSTPFSFFRNIYLPKGIYEKEERELILQHEMSHIHFGHSSEKMFLLLNKVFFWWNPIVYRYFTELELIHEYQVDEKLCNSSSKKFYGQFLLSQLNTQSQYSFVNNISSHIKNRIMMISSKNKNTPSTVKWGAYLTMFVAVMFLHACNIDNDEPLIEDNYKEKVANKLKAEANTPDFTTIQRVDTMIVFDYETQKESVEITTSEVKIYNTPEVMPIFGKCSSNSDVDARYECSNGNLLSFIYSNLLYPEEARSNGIEGVTVVQFIVDDYGDIQSEKIVRSLSPSTDQAVLNVLNKMKDSDTKWTSGRQGGENISTKFTLPVKFKLEG